MNSLAATEIAAGIGYDWVLLDMEHSPYDLESVERHLLAARHGGDAEFVVRIPSIDPILVKRLLDAGVRSFMYPFVQTEAEAALAVAATRFPPDGIRGFSGNSRSSRYGLQAGYHPTAHEDICIILQVETPQAVAAIPEYCRHGGVDGILVGPNDLAANMGRLGGTQHPEVLAKIDEFAGADPGRRQGGGDARFQPRDLQEAPRGRLRFPCGRWRYGVDEPVRQAVAQGLWPVTGYALRRVVTEADRQAMHAIRRDTLFAPGRHAETVVYDENHPHDLAEGHVPYLLELNGRPIGVVRLDFRGEIAVVRLVGILTAEQGRGHGRVLDTLAVEEARAARRAPAAGQRGQSARSGFTKRTDGGPRCGTPRNWRVLPASAPRW